MIIVVGPTRPRAVYRPTKEVRMTCDRCHNNMNVYRVSWFDTARICETCQREEETHPDYGYAREVEHAAVRSGDLNFPGVGWPGRDGRVSVQ